MKATQAATLKYLVHWASPEVISVPLLEAVGVLNLAPLKSETDKHGQWRKEFPFSQIVFLAGDNMNRSLCIKVQKRRE